MTLFTRFMTLPTARFLLKTVNSANRNEWSFSIPDGFGRVVLSGICKNQPAYGAESTPLDTVVVKAVWANEENPLKGYRLEGITLSSPTVLSVNYYDSYDFLGKNGIPDDATTAYCRNSRLWQTLWR